MSVLISILAFVVTIGILVTFHELGHYWVAKRCGIKVLTFSIGFGKKLLSWQRGETTWQLAAVPLGGYVRMLDERERPVTPEELPRSFNQQHPLKKMAVAAAGPVANLLLALLFYWVLFVSGVTTLKPVLADVTAGSVAQQIGLRAGDRIDAIGNRPVNTWDDLAENLIDSASKHEPFDIAVHSQSGDVTLPVDPARTSLGEIDANLIDRFGISPLPITTVIGQVAPDSAAAQADIKAGDRIVSLNGKPLQSWSALQQAVAHYPIQPVQLVLDRHGEHISKTVTPHEIVVKGQHIGQLGLAPRLDEARWKAQQMQLRYGPVDAIGAAATKVVDTVKFILQMFGRMIVGHVSVKQIGGPVTLADLAGRSAEMGLLPFIENLARISLSLAVLNLLPVPLLDGGHLMYHTAELVTGRPVPERVQAFGMRLGLAFIAGLMALALYNDFFRLISG
ncbi:RIP metalloprotease RseP [Silvimonas iriomotensis]|uniref:Zinc metalloprotease n=1 Tax=Silvimonas iriomotensis TaxID=449662 RepID=A0ABQ2P5F0_9NEIS|nr:RIP metalloprotease RseP [Silvimonas iriomotensis]GGP18751.1 putative zinc metalloprotease [Silvimonas iriomotensis]